MLTNPTIPAFFSLENANIADLDTLCSQATNLSDYAFADAVEKNIVIYDGGKVRQALTSPDQEVTLKAELTCCLNTGPGVFAVKNAYDDLDVIDQTTDLFLKIIAEEKASGQGQGDHFGQNERIWNSFQKACMRAPDLFIDYYGNPILALASTAWLGPYYQITAQVNNVKPGSAAQSAHRDYHLGFQSQEAVAQFPAHAQVISQYLTLQGAIAHTNMTLDTGPTLLLPYSQQFAPGYIAYTQPEFAAYFDEHSVQIPFDKGDMVFFSPALFHGAGTNQSSADRIANLVQISSAFGRPMETINRYAMIEAVYPALLKRTKAQTLSEHLLNDTIMAVADGYSFPTNLDSDPPLGGNAPETTAQLMHRALASRWTLTQLQDALSAYIQRRQA